MKPFAVLAILLVGLTSACGWSTPQALATLTASPREPVPLQTLTASPIPTATTVQPRFEPAPCWGALPPGVLATCGYVIVPENRSRPFGEGNSIKLAVEVLRAAGARYAQPPTFLLGGGPGQDVVGLFVNFFKDYQFILDHGYPAEKYIGHLQDMQQFKAVMDLFVANLQQREFILIDQRGAGYSLPSLKCRGEDWDVCRSRLVASGVNLAAYNTLENASDVNDIRQALGYGQINLQGGSYGTRLALEFLRRYPQFVRAVVLDGVVPPQVDWAVEMVSRYGDALNVLFDHCQSDPACNAAYPELETVFYNLVERLNDQPVDVRVGDQSLALDGDDLRDLVWNALYDTNKIRFLPMLIGQVSQGQTAVWGQMFASFSTPQGEETIAWGMHYAAECAERWAFETPQDLVAVSSGLNPVIREAVVRYFADNFETCRLWAVPEAPAIVHTPVRSDVPSLLVSGEFDPGTPPAFGTIAAETLAHHYNLVFPYLGHTDGFTSLCYSSVIAGFLDNPYRAPDTTCIQQMDQSVFVLK